MANRQLINVMLSNYLKIAWRNLNKDKFYISTNILGLAVGIGVCLIISFYINGELSYDSFHENKEQIFRLTEEKTRNGNYQKGSYTSYTLAQQMELDIPEIENIVTVKANNGSAQFKNGENVYSNLSYIYSEPEFFDVFTFPLINSQKQNLLNTPYSIVISESLALRVFGTNDVIGKTISTSSTMRDANIYTISGVFKDIPSNSHLSFDAVLSFESLLSTNISLDNSQFYNYALLADGIETNTLSEKTLNAAITALGKEMVEYLDYKVSYEPLSEVYLSELWGPKTGDKNYITIFSLIAVFILLIGMVNYTNLAIARSSERSLEVGIRKVTGATKFELIKQFLSESTVYSVLAIPLALVIVDLFLPYFNQLLNSEITWTLTDNVTWLLLIAGVILIAGILSSIYPAFILSAFKPIDSLKGINSKTNTRGVFFKKGLITFQFIISSLLIISTIIITRQLGFIQNKKLGFDQNLLISINLSTPENRPSSEIIKNEFLKNPNVIKASRSFGTPEIRFASMSLPIERVDSTKISAQLQIARIDEDFASTLGLNFIAGSDFNKNDLSIVEKGCIINQSAVYALGWTNPNEAIGRQVGDHHERLNTIIAVVEDFHYESIHNRIEPLILVTDSTRYSFYPSLNLRVTPGNLNETVSSIQSTWNSFSTGSDLDFQFVDDAVERLYINEQNIAKLFNFFAFISIIISCIGLLGLTAYSAQRRTKEIGVRKVLGAAVTDIVRLLTKDFLILVLLGFTISIPITWYFMNQWLQEFAYRIDIGLGTFLVSGIISVSIALATVSWQAIKAAIANPVESLRNE